MKRLVVILLAMALICSLLPQTALFASATTAGMCGKDLTWNFFQGNREIHIYGKGTMFDYNGAEPPWQFYAPTARSVYVDNGVTSIGSSAFKGFDALRRVFISQTVTSIGSNAFQDCKNLSDVSISSGVESIAEGAFSGCNNLKSVAVLNAGCSIFPSPYTLGNSDITTVYGYDNSTAQVYAMQYGYEFKTLDEYVGTPESEIETAIDLVFVVDTSGSMSSSDATIGTTGGTMQRINAVSQMLNGAVSSMTDDGFISRFLALNTDNRVSVVGFANNSSVLLNWTNYKNKSYVNCLQASGGTDYSVAIRKAGELFMDNPDHHAQVMVFLSDGEANSIQEAKSQYDNLKMQYPNLYTYTIGFGRSFETAALNYMATEKFTYTTQDAENLMVELESFMNQASGNLASGVEGGMNKLYIKSISSNHKSVSNKAKFKLTFNEPVEFGLGYLELHNAKDDSIVGQFVLSNSAQIVSIDGNVVTIDISQLELIDGGYYALISQRAFKTKSGVYYCGLGNKAAWDFFVSSNNDDIMEYEKTGILFWKKDDTTKPAIPNGSDSQYALLLAKWAKENGIDNLSAVTTQNMLNNPMYIPATDINGSKVFLNDKKTTVKQSVEDILFLESLKPFTKELDKSLSKVTVAEPSYNVFAEWGYDQENEIYEDVISWYPQVQKYLDRRNKNSNLFYSSASALAYQGLITLADAVGTESVSYKYIKPFLKADLDTAIEQDSLRSLSKYNSYKDFKDASKTIGNAISAAKIRYTASNVATSKTVKSCVQLAGSLLQDAFEKSGNTTLKKIGKGWKLADSAKSAGELCVFLGSSIGAFPMLVDLYNGLFEEASNRVGAFYFVSEYYVNQKYPDLYDAIYNDQTFFPDPYDPEVHLDYQSIIESDAVLENWYQFHYKEIESRNRKDCRQLRFDLTNYIMLLQYAKEFNAEASKTALVKYLSAEHSEESKTTLYTSCPVTVEVYDKVTDSLLTSLSSTDKEIPDCEYGTLYLMGENNETKCFIFNSNDYYAKIVPYDEGVMNVSVVSEDGGDYFEGKVFSEVPLTKGNSFTLDLSDMETGLESDEGLTVEKESTIPVTSIDLSGDEELPVGDSMKLTATIRPLVATDRTITWSSSDESVATVDTEGTVTAIGNGETVISATSSDGVVGEIPISVYTPADYLRMESETLLMMEGEKFQLSAETSQDATHSIRWRSNNISAVTVEDDGTVCARAAGSAIVTAAIDGLETSVLVNIFSDQLDVQMYQEDRYSQKVKIILTNQSSIQSASGNAYIAVYESGQMIDIKSVSFDILPNETTEEYIKLDDFTPNESYSVIFFGENSPAKELVLVNGGYVTAKSTEAATSELPTCRRTQIECERLKPGETYTLYVLTNQSTPSANNIAYLAQKTAEDETLQFTVALTERYFESTCYAYLCDESNHMTLISEFEPHDIEKEYTSVAPTCTQQGIDTYTCSVCGWHKTVTIAALGHDWDDGITTQPTCTENGRILYSCKVCGAQRTTTLSPFGHNYELAKADEGTEYTEGREIYTCTVCKDSYEITTGHHYTVSFNVCGTVTETKTCSSINGLILPVGPALPDLDNDFHFAGWSETPVNCRDNCGSLLLAGKNYFPTGNTTLYAVYAYPVADGPTQDISIGSGSSYGYSGNSPYNLNYHYATTEMLYRASEIGSAGMITQIAFNVATASSINTNDLKIYLAVTSNDSLTTSSAFYTEDLTLVYSGSPMLGTATGWEPIMLDTPFVYDGVSNLVVVTAQYVPSYTSNLRYYYTNVANSYIYRQSDSYSGYGDVANHNYNFSSTSYRPNARFTVDTKVYNYTSQTENIHLHEYVEQTKPAICTEPGYKTLTCTVCNDVIVTEFVPLGHHFIDGICERCGMETSGFVKITSKEELKEGTYLIVYEPECLIFDGSLEKLDVGHNNYAVEINVGIIEANDTTLASAFTLSQVEGGWSIQAANGKYISGSSTTNTIVTGDAPVENAVSFDENGNAVVFSNAYLMFNNTSGDTTYRFRYYKKQTQQPIQLYRLIDTVSTEAHPHSVTLHEAVAPTCTENGTVRYFTCDEPTCECSGRYYADAALTEELTSVNAYPKGHDLVITKPTAATCTEPAYGMGCCCADCGEEIIVPTILQEALGHELRYIYNDFDTHTASCIRCSYRNSEAHTYTDGVCICGAADLNGKLKIRSAFPRLNENIDLIFVAEIPDKFKNPYMVFNFHDTEYRVTDYTVNEEGQLCFEFPHINPQCMGDTISATLHASCYGMEFSAAISDYSIKAYCFNQLVKHADDETLVALLSDILTYGAAAQVYMDYKTDELVTKGLALTPSTFEAINGKAVSFTGEQDKNTRWTGATLVLSNDLAMRFTFVTDSTEDLAVEVSINGRTQTCTQFADLGNGKYAVTFDGIMATEFDDTVTAKFIRNGEQLGAAVNYSVNTYICGTQNCENASLQALVRALYNYGVDAKAYADANK